MHEPGARAAGRGICIAVIDSGVHAQHPHVGGIAGGMAIDSAGRVTSDFVDRVGHGTAVMAAIKERAPHADCYALRIFDRQLTAPVSTLLAALEWAVQSRVHVVNLSLGTSRVSHAAAFAAAVDRARAAGVVIVSARDDEGTAWLPGILPGVVGVQADWDCPREAVRVRQSAAGPAFRASGLPRPIPGVDPRRNLHGVSFAVANVTGTLAACWSRYPEASAAAVVQRLADEAAREERADQKKGWLAELREPASDRDDRAPVQPARRTANDKPLA